MGLIQGSNLAGWSGASGKYFYRDAATQFGDNNLNIKHLRLEAMLQNLARVPYCGTGYPTANNDNVDTAGLGRPFRKGSIWTNETDKNQWVLIDDSATAAVWESLTDITEVSSSSSQSSSSSSSNSSSPSTAGLSTSSQSESSSNSSSSQSESSSESTMSSSSSSSSTLAGNTSSSTQSGSSSSSSSP